MILKICKMSHTYGMSNSQMKSELFPWNEHLIYKKLSHTYGMSTYI